MLVLKYIKILKILKNLYIAIYTSSILLVLQAPKLQPALVCDAPSVLLCTTDSVLLVEQLIINCTQGEYQAYPEDFLLL